MMTNDYANGLYDDINREQVRRRSLEEKVAAQEAIVKEILSMGVQHLKDRLSELDMDHVTEVTELLQGSKRIVAHHKELHQRVSSQETENASLEAKLRNVCPYGDRIVEKLHSLDQNDNNAVEGCPDKYIMLIQKTAIETGHPIPKLEPDPIDAELLAAATTSAPAKRSRPRPRAGPGGKRGKPEENSEEMERQIQEIVQAALRVDSAAKEKERRARGGGAAASAGGAAGFAAGVGPEQRNQRTSSGSGIGGPGSGPNSTLPTPTDLINMKFSANTPPHQAIVPPLANTGILGPQQPGQQSSSIISPITSQPI